MYERITLGGCERKGTHLTHSLLITSLHLMSLISFLPQTLIISCPANLSMSYFVVVVLHIVHYIHHTPGQHGRVNTSLKNHVIMFSVAYLQRYK